jgi:hypothetical protein
VGPFFLVAVMSTPSSVVWAQTAAAPPPATEAPAGAYTYNPGSRRDPFVSLLSRGADVKTVSKPSSDVSGLATADITVKGIVMSRGGFVAMIQAPDQRTFIVRPNDHLLDGRVTAVTAVDVVITQDVNDPLSLVKQRDVRKPLRAMDQGQ